MIPDNQARKLDYISFRRERSTLDYIFILMHLIQRERNQEDKKKIYMLFADLKAAFDKVKRSKL